MAGTSGRSAFAPAVFDARQWRRQARAARGALAAPGAVPLLTAAGTAVPAGTVIRAVGRRWRPVLAVPAAAFARHMVIVGASGTGKTNLMIRLWAGW
jgi:predicted NACHT family NTPase